MPINSFQRMVLRLLRKNRNPNSYVAGGIAINRLESSPRHSNDIDFFHDTDEAVSLSAQADLALLQKESFEIELLIDQPSFVCAVIRQGSNSLKLEWARDTAFRFYPLIEDDDLGCRLHDIDLAVNKCLALANRNEVRDIIDLIQFEKTLISLGAACWAACGKDPGFTPDLIIDCISRHSIIRPEQLAAESLTEKLSPPQLKKEWLKKLTLARELISKLPAADLGCIYITRAGVPVHQPVVQELSSYSRHFASVGGSWPVVK